MAPRTDNTVENFPERFEAGLKKFLAENPEFVDAQGKPGGYFSLDIHDGLRASFIPFVGAGYKGFTVPFGTNKPTPEISDAVTARAAEICMAHGFFPHARMGQSHSRESIQKEVEAWVTSILCSDQEFLNSSRGIKGIFTVAQNLTKDTKRAHNIVISLRPYSDIENSQHRYVKRPYEFKMSAGSSDVEEVKRLCRYAAENLKDMGFDNKNLIVKKSDTKIIPKEWIDITHIRTLKLTSSPYYNLQIVPDLSSKRYPIIRFSTGLSDETWANRARDAIIQDYITPRLAPGSDPITLSGIKSFLSLWLEQQPDYVKPEKVQREASPTQIRDVYNIRGEPKCRFFTPVYNLSGGYVVLNIAPYAEEKAVTNQCSSISFSLNTRDARLQRIRGQIINHIAVATLTQYFAQHPEATLVTESRIKKIKEKDTPLTLIQSQPSRPYAVSPTVNELNALLQNDHTAPDISGLAYALYEAIQNAGINETRETELAASLRRALRCEAGEHVTEDASALDIAMLLGVTKFLGTHKKYQVARGIDGDVISLEVNRAMHIDADYLSNAILRPAIKQCNDYPRFIVWNMDAKPADPTDENGAQIITLKAIKNPLSINEPAEPPFDKEFTLRSDTAEHAREFIDAVNDHLYKNVLTGIQRPVEHFGMPSQCLVFTQSLGVGLLINGITVPDDCPVKKIIAELKRSAVTEKRDRPR